MIKDKLESSFDMDKEINNTHDFPKSLRCSDGAEIAETPRNWEKYLKNPECFQNEYIERVKKWLNRPEK